MALTDTLAARLRAIHALMIRDLMVRFGRHHLGFIWTVLEPMILTVGVMGIWSLIHAPIVHGIPVAALVLTGYMPLTLWRHMTNPMTRVFRNNSGLLYHAPITQFDIAVARIGLEFLSTSAALAVIYFIVVSTGIVAPLYDPSLVLLGWIGTLWLFGGLGLLLGALTEYWEPAERFIQPFQYLMLPLSGVFFMVEWLPSEIQPIMTWNPTVHCFEIFRAGFFGDAITTHYSVPYLFGSGAVLNFLGFAAVHHVRERIQFT